MIKRILVGLAGTSYTPVAIERAVTLLRKILGDTLLATLRDTQIPLFLAQ